MKKIYSIGLTLLVLMLSLFSFSSCAPRAVVVRPAAIVRPAVIVKPRAVKVRRGGRHHHRRHCH